MTEKITFESPVPEEKRGRPRSELHPEDLAGLTPEHAAEKIIETYGSYIKKVCSGAVYNFTKGEAEDVVQKTFLSIFNARANISGIKDIKAWVGTIAVRVARDLSRKGKVRKLDQMQSLTASEGGRLAHQIAAEGLSPEEIVLKNELEKKVQEAVSHLNPKYRDVVQLRYFSGLSTKEVAERLKISEAAVKSQLLRAQGMLGLRLRDLGLGESKSGDDVWRNKKKERGEAAAMG